MLKPPAPSPASTIVRKIKQKNKQSNSVKAMQLNKGTIKQSINKKPNMKHYLAIEMGLDTDPAMRTRKSKKHQSLSVDDLPEVVEKTTDYEHRTVNSVADVTDNNENSEPKKRLKRKRKPELIDSEVDLLKSKESRPHLNMNTLLQKNLPVIEECKVEEVLPKPTKAKKKKISKTGPLSAVSPIATSKAKKPSQTAHLEGGGNSKLSVGAGADQYPVLRNQELVDRFLKVELTNNQKGRIRQVIKDILRGTSQTMLPEVINNKIQAILSSTSNLTDTDLRKIRILYNMLKKATEDIKTSSDLLEKEEEELNKQKEDTEKGEEKPKKKKEKVKEGSRRYVVFLGNLPLDVTREMILKHFEEIRGYIKDVRIPQLAEDKKSCIAYVELENAPVYEMALAKHHTMMGKKRINVQYTSPNKKSKISKTVAKAKSAKLTAMAKKGQLIGSIPLTKKRSHRRAKARAAQKAEASASENKPNYLPQRI